MTAAHSLLLLLFFLRLHSFTPILGSVLFSNLPQTLVVSASPKPNQVLTAGEDNVTVTWSVRKGSTIPIGGGYKAAKVKLCYAPASQEDRAWRKTRDDLSRDKTCQFSITTVPFDASNVHTVAYSVDKDVPTATYFVRVYAVDEQGKEIAYGQTTDAKKQDNLFRIQGITGRHASLDIAAACFSAASLAALAFFVVAERREGKK